MNATVGRVTSPDRIIDRVVTLRAWCLAEGKMDPAGIYSAPRRDGPLNQPDAVAE